MPLVGTNGDVQALWHAVRVVLPAYLPSTLHVLRICNKRQQEEEEAVCGFACSGLFWSANRDGDGDKGTANVTDPAGVVEGVGKIQT